MDVQRFNQLLLEQCKSEDQVCLELNIDPKSLRGWRDGTISPRRTSIEKVIDYFGVPVFELFPEYGTPRSSAFAEISNAWAHRSDSPKDFWWKFFEEAERQIDLLGYAMQFFHEDHRDFVNLLKKKSQEECRIRIVMADPQSDAAKGRDQEEGLRGGLVARIRTSLTYFEPVIGMSNIEIRLQSFPMYNSIFRFDDDMLVTPHLYHEPGRLAPLFHFRLGEREGLFKTYLDSFEKVFTNCKPVRVTFG